MTGNLSLLMTGNVLFLVKFCDWWHFVRWNFVTGYV
jgi:hypothetical protein